MRVALALISLGIIGGVIPTMSGPVVLVLVGGVSSLIIWNALCLVLGE